MWVSRDKWEALTKRVHELEQWKTRHEVDVGDGRNFTVYSPTKTEYVYTNYGHSYERRASQQISVKDVISRVLERLGVELVYVEGKPACVAVEKAKKAA